MDNRKRYIAICDEQWTLIEWAVIDELAKSYEAAKKEAVKYLMNEIDLTERKLEDLHQCLEEVESLAKEEVDERMKEFHQEEDWLPSQRRKVKREEVESNA